MDYSKMTVAQLKEALKDKGLSQSGKKSELVERLSEKPKKVYRDKHGNIIHYRS